MFNDCNSSPFYEHSYHANWAVSDKLCLSPMEDVSASYSKGLELQSLFKSFAGNLESFFLKHSGFFGVDFSEIQVKTKVNAEKKVWKSSVKFKPKCLEIQISM